MDYRTLLIKYIDHVIGQEGVSFIADDMIDDDLTDEEKAVLVECDEAARKSRKEGFR